MLRAAGPQAAVEAKGRSAYGGFGGPFWRFQLQCMERYGPGTCLPIQPHAAGQAASTSYDLQLACRWIRTSFTPTSSSLSRKVISLRCGLLEAHGPALLVLPSCCHKAKKGLYGTG